jgi:hypothetical protein
MTLPPHIDSFKRFNELIPNDHLLASVAFGVFMQGERVWIDQQDPEPTEAKCRNYHHSYLTDHEIERYKQAAVDLLTNYANGVVGTTRSEFLEQSLSDYRNAAFKGHKRFRLWGIVEATGGAFLWSVILVVILLIIAIQGIDIFEIYRRATGSH